jgi:hypothetical protein
VQLVRAAGNGLERTGHMGSIVVGFVAYHSLADRKHCPSIHILREG